MRWFIVHPYSRIMSLRDGHPGAAEQESGLSENQEDEPKCGTKRIKRQLSGVVEVLAAALDDAAEIEL